MSDFLEQVVAERRAYVAKAGASGSDGVITERVENLASRAGLQSGRDVGWRAGGDHSDAFTGTLRQRRREGRLGLIAEVKRVSPALGTLAADIDPARQARLYADAGAAAISVLTEPLHWGGSMQDLAAVRKALPSTPILCKDVIVSEYQIIEARNAGADAVLLIAEALTDAELRRFLQLAFTLDMGALVEAHEPVAFGRAVACGARVVGVNARDLRDPRQIDIGRVRQLHGSTRPDQILVAESGISSVDDARLLPARVDAVLVGTALMTSDDPTPLAHGLSHIARPVTA